MQTKEQIRAEFALNKINSMIENKTLDKEATFLVGLPTLVLTNGLGQSLAFLLSKKKKDSRNINAFDVIKDWLGKENPCLQESGSLEFLKAVSKLSQSEYIAAQKETLALLAWVKRYARAFEKEEKNG